MAKPSPIQVRISEVRSLRDDLREEIMVISRRKEDWLQKAEEAALMEEDAEKRLSKYEFLLAELEALEDPEPQSETDQSKPTPMVLNGKKKNVRGPLLNWRPLYQILPTKPEEALPISVLRDMIEDEELAEKNRHKFRDQLAKWEKHGVVRRKKTGTKTTSWYRLPTAKEINLEE